MVIHLDPKTEVLAIGPQLDKLIAEGARQADDPLQRLCGEAEDVRLFLKTSAFYQTLCRLMATLARQAAHSLEATRRYQACRAAVMADAACPSPIDDVRWEVNYLTLDYQVRRYLPELVERLAQIQREVLPLLVQALHPAEAEARRPAELRLVHVMLDSHALAAC